MDTLMSQWPQFSLTLLVNYLLLLVVAKLDHWSPNGFTPLLRNLGPNLQLLPVLLPRPNLWDQVLFQGTLSSFVQRDESLSPLLLANHISTRPWRGDAKMLSRSGFNWIFWGFPCTFVLSSILDSCHFYDTFSSLVWVLPSPYPCTSCSKCPFKNHYKNMKKFIKIMFNKVLNTFPTLCRTWTSRIRYFAIDNVHQFPKFNSKLQFQVYFRQILVYTCPESIVHSIGPNLTPFTSSLYTFSPICPWQPFISVQ